MFDPLEAALTRRTFFKAISGLDVFDRDRVLAIVRAARLGADAIDIAADPDLVAAARAEAPELVVFASATDPDALVRSGADVLELGNYDAIYRAGGTVSADDVLSWTRAVGDQTAGRMPLCVTIPGRLPQPDQVALALQAQAAGATMLQSEGVLGPRGQGVAGSIAQLLEALANTTALRGAVSLPIILAGGVDPHNAPHAIAAGADGVGVGRFLKEAPDMPAAVAQIRAALDALGSRRSGERPISARA